MEAALVGQCRRNFLSDKQAHDIAALKSNVQVIDFELEHQDPITYNALMSEPEIVSTGPTTTTIRLVFDVTEWSEVWDSRFHAREMHDSAVARSYDFSPNRYRELMGKQLRAGPQAVQSYSPMACMRKSNRPDGDLINQEQRRMRWHATPDLEGDAKLSSIREEEERWRPSLRPMGGASSSGLTRPVNLVPFEQLPAEPIEMGLQWRYGALGWIRMNVEDVMLSQNEWRDLYYGCIQQDLPPEVCGPNNYEPYCEAWKAGDKWPPMIQSDHHLLYTLDTPTAMRHQDAEGIVVFGWKSVRDLLVYPCHDRLFKHGKGGVLTAEEHEKLNAARTAELEAARGATSEGEIDSKVISHKMSLSSCPNRKSDCSTRLLDEQQERYHMSEWTRAFILDKTVKMPFMDWNSPIFGNRFCEHYSTLEDEFYIRTPYDTGTADKGYNYGAATKYVIEDWWKFGAGSRQKIASCQMMEVNDYSVLDRMIMDAHETQEVHEQQPFPPLEWHNTCWFQPRNEHVKPTGDTVTFKPIWNAKYMMQTKMWESVYRPGTHQPESLYRFWLDSRKGVVAKCYDGSFFHDGGYPTIAPVSTEVPFDCFTGFLYQRLQQRRCRDNVSYMQPGECIQEDEFMPSWTQLIDREDTATNLQLTALHLSLGISRIPALREIIKDNKDLDTGWQINSGHLSDALRICVPPDSHRGMQVDKLVFKNPRHKTRKEIIPDAAMRKETAILLEEIYLDLTKLKASSAFELNTWRDYDTFYTTIFDHPVVFDYVAPYLVNPVGKKGTGHMGYDPEIWRRTMGGMDHEPPKRKMITEWLQKTRRACHKAKFRVRNAPQSERHKEAYIIQITCCKENHHRAPMMTMLYGGPASHRIFNLRTLRGNHNQGRSPGYANRSCRDVIPMFIGRPGSEPQTPYREVESRSYLPDTCCNCGTVAAADERYAMQIDFYKIALQYAKELWSVEIDRMKTAERNLRHYGTRVH